MEKMGFRIEGTKVKGKIEVLIKLGKNLLCDGKEFFGKGYCL